jgi:hypothetical protein
MTSGPPRNAVSHDVVGREHGRGVQRGFVHERPAALERHPSGAALHDLTRPRKLIEKHAGQPAIGVEGLPEFERVGASKPRRGLAPLRKSRHDNDKRRDG